MRLFLALSLSLGVAMPALAADPGPVVAAERAFAEETSRIGLERGFLKYSTPDAITIGAAVSRVHEAMDPNAPEAPPNPMIAWFPIWAGVSMSGDLGFTSGPVEVGGRRVFTYFTIWSRQPDGSWKWVYDGGVGASSKDDPGPDSAPVYLPTATVGSPSPQAAMADVNAAEAELARQAALDQKRAHLAAFAPEGRLHIAPLAPARTPVAVATLLDRWPATMRLALLGGGASQAGDLAWTYGTADWTRDGAENKGHYVHVWQKRADGWKLAFAQILPG